MFIYEVAKPLMSRWPPSTRIEDFNVQFDGRYCVVNILLYIACNMGPNICTLTNYVGNYFM